MQKLPLLVFSIICFLFLHMPLLLIFNTKLTMKTVLICMFANYFFSKYTQSEHAQTVWMLTGGAVVQIWWQHWERWECSVLLLQSEVLPAAASTLIPSPLTSFLHAEVLGHCLSTLLTLHCAAPVEFTITAWHHLSFALLHSQPTLSAKPLAAPFLPFAQVLSLLEALAALCARQAQSAVL